MRLLERQRQETRDTPYRVVSLSCLLNVWRHAETLSPFVSACLHLGRIPINGEVRSGRAPALRTHSAPREILCSVAPSGSALLRPFGSMSSQRSRLFITDLRR